MKRTIILSYGTSLALLKQPVADSLHLICVIERGHMLPGTADEVANVAALLMSDAGAFITGFSRTSSDSNSSVISSNGCSGHSSQASAATTAASALTA